MGHYIAGLRRGLDVTPPFFIPAIPPLGAFGAFIKIKSPITDRDTLLEVGASGPLAGSLIAVPLLLIGLYHSEIIRLTPIADGFRLSFGSSLLTGFFTWLFHGTPPAGHDVLLHPTATAAHFGLFVTALNLLPMGQLDGGHVVYAVVGARRARFVSIGVFLALIPLAAWKWPGWIVFGGLVFILGLKHPPLLVPYRPLAPRLRLMAALALILFAVTFTPTPVYLE
jgi:membrane-associated protease RseP (regulator of RpoE activity)